MNLYYKTGKLLLLPILMILMVLSTNKTMSQTTITTETGSNFTGANGVSGNSAITFVIENTTAVSKILTQVDCYWTVANSGGIPTLWYSSTSLGGAPTIATPTWTSITTGPAVTVSTSGYTPVFTGLSFIIPAGAVYRFAIQSSTGISYSGAAGPPSPNTFSAGGVNLKVYDFQYTGNVGYGGSFPSPANNPRAFTGRITFIDATPCTGTPAPGNTISSANPVCSGVNFSLSVQNATAGSGVTYQWQSSPDGTTWTDIAGATNSTLIRNQAAATYYRNKVTCSGNTGISNSLQVTMNAPSACYCTPPITNCNAGDEISNVTFGTINNTTTCSPNGYGNYVGIVAPATVNIGSTVPLSVTVTNGGTEYAAAWIDWNQNGVFEPSEFTLMGSGPGGTFTQNIVVPGTAVPGATRMRVRVEYFTALAGTDACIGYTYGETEDYAINVNSTGCLPGAFTAQPANQTVFCGITATFSVTTTGTSITHQWQVSTNGGTTWTNITNNANYSGATTNSLSVTGAGVAFSGNQYRDLLNGTCTTNFASSAATLTVNNFATPTVTPSSATVCANGAPVLLSLTVPTGTTTVSSGTISVPIPDNNAAGATHTMTVSTVPAGAVITGIDVTLNMTHTWVGDMIFNLKAPNSSILALDKYITGTGGAGVTTGFTNTVISSAGTTALSGSANIVAYTGTYKADAINTPVAGPTIQNPTGYISNAANFAALYSTPNGAWTLAMADGGAGDVGTLTSWSIKFTYTIGSPTPGIWSPVAGLYTDAAATIPYVANTPTLTVYARPAATTTYSVVNTNPYCTSPATNVVITVNNPAVITTQPLATAACAGNNATFSVAATGTAPLTYQWQDSVAAWANIAGATSSSFTLNGVTNAMNGRKYRVLVSSAAPCGATTSSVAVLTVNPLPTVTISASPYTRLFPGLFTTLTATATPAASSNVFSWFRNGAPVTGTGNTISVGVDALGDYTASVKDANGCVSALSGIVTVGDSVSNKLFIYPNPSTGKFQVRYYSVNGNVLGRTLSIYDAKGARVLTQTYSVGRPYDRMDVDMTNIGRGIYWVELGDLNGKRIIVGRIVKL